MESEKLELAAHIMHAVATAVIRCAGMNAENEYRKLNGQGVAYLEHNFYCVEEEMHDKVRELLG